MTDPKGTYYSPQESGFATVLRPGPNFLGMAQQQQALAAKRDQLAMQRQAKIDNEREKQVGKIAADMGKPVPTAFPWQEETNKRLTEGLNKIQKMYLDDKPVSDIRFEAERTVADVISYGAAAKQFFAEANGNVKKLGKEYKQDEVLKLVAGKFVGEDGTPIDARKADWEDINPEKAIFESPEPWKFLDENLVVKGFLNNPTFQENAMSIQKKVDTGELGRFYKVGTTTTSTKAAGKIYSIDPMTGTSQISDADTLIENGVFDMMLGDRKMLAVVDKYVNELTSDRLVPIDEDQKDIMRAGVLADLLEKRTPGPSTIQRINEKYMPKNASSGSGRLPQWMIEQEEDAAYMNQWKQDVSSGNPKTVKEALDYLNVQLGISEDARTALVEAIDAPDGYELKDVELINDSKLPATILAAKKLVGMDSKKPGIYATFEDSRGNKQYRPINPNLLGEFGSQVYSTAFKRTGRNYKQELPLVPQQQQPVQKGRYD